MQQNRAQIPQTKGLAVAEPMGTGAVYAEVFTESEMGWKPILPVSGGVALAAEVGLLRPVAFDPAGDHGAGGVVVGCGDRLAQASQDRGNLDF